MPHNTFTELKEKKFIIVTGKGGTGKSTLAASLACSINALGKGVILGEMARAGDQKTKPHEIFQSPKDPQGQNKIKNPLDPEKNIEILALDEEIALKEYLELRLGKLSSKLFLKNNFIQVFFSLVPGLSDLLCLGKIWHLLHTENIDTFILDAPSSGHSLSLMQSPERFSKIIKMGPAFQESSQMKDFFSNSMKSTILYTAIPEKMSLEESKEYYSLFKNIGFDCTLLINKCIEKIENEEEVEESSPLHPAWAHYQKLSKNRELHLEKFYSFYENPLELPYFFSKNKHELVKEYAQFLQKKIQEETYE